MSSLPARSCRLDLTCDLSAPRAARQQLTRLLRQWGVRDQDVLDSATIVVSELVTNVLVHCDESGPVRVLVDLDDTRLRLGVEDPSPTVPVQRAAEPDDESGRGLGLVEQLATAVVVEQLVQGKRVVVDLPLPTRRCA